jgi:hypothetical protein
LALLNILAFLEVHLNQLTVDAALHRHSVKCCDTAESVQINRQILPRCCGHYDRHGTAPAPSATGASRSATRRRTSLRRRGGLRFVRAAPHKYAAYDRGYQQKEDNPTLPGTLCGGNWVTRMEADLPVGCTFSK